MFHSSGNKFSGSPTILDSLDPTVTKEGFVACVINTNNTFVGEPTLQNTAGPGFGILNKNCLFTDNSTTINSINDPTSASKAMSALKNRLTSQNQAMEKIKQNVCCVCKLESYVTAHCGKCQQLICWKHSSRLEKKDYCPNCAKTLVTQETKEFDCQMKQTCHICQKKTIFCEKCIFCHKLACNEHLKRTHSIEIEYGCTNCMKNDLPSTNTKIKIKNKNKSPPKKPRIETEQSQPESKPKKAKGLKCTLCKQTNDLSYNQTSCSHCGTPFIASANDPRIKIASTQIKPGISLQENVINDSVYISSDSKQFFQDLPSAPLPPPVYIPSVVIDPKTQQPQVVLVPQKHQKTTTIFTGEVTFDNFNENMF